MPRALPARPSHALSLRVRVGTPLPFAAGRGPVGAGPELTTAASLSASEGTCPKQCHVHRAVLLLGIAGADGTGCPGLTGGAKEQRLHGGPTGGRITRAGVGGVRAAAPAARGLTHTGERKEVWGPRGEGNGAEKVNGERMFERQLPLLPMLADSPPRFPS